MADTGDGLEHEQIKEFFPHGLNSEQATYIHALHNEVEILSHHLYEIQNNLAQWMVSQKAFKEAAIQIGLDNGMRIEDIMCKAKLLKMNVLENKNNPFHGTNAKDSEFLVSHVEELKAKIFSNQ
jgi:hypothetical protein